MRYSDDLVREVISRNNIIDIIGAEVRLRKSGGNYTGLCPFHNEKTPSFSVSESRQMYYCFGCHTGGNVITFLMNYYNYTFLEALKFLADRAGMTLPEEELSAARKEESLRKASLLAACKEAAVFYHYRLRSDAGSAGYRYLRDRGLTDETIRHFGLGYADRFGDSLYRHLKSKEFTDDVLNDTGLFRFDEKKGVSDRFWNRVMFPILDERGRVIGFGGRVMGDGKPKYLNSPEGILFNKRRHLYALNFARSSRDGYLILCEGYMDVISMHQAGFRNAVASLGTALTPEQCTLLRRFTGEVKLLYDSDGAGSQAALRAIPLLKEAGISSRVVSLLPCKDPDELLKKEGPEALRHRIGISDDAFMYEISRLKEGYRRDEPSEWTAFQHETAKRLAGIPDELERMNYLEAVSSRYGLPPDAMKRLVSRIALQGTPAEHYVPPKSGRKGEAGNGQETELMAQKLMLSYLAAYPDAYTVTKDLIGPGDFPDPMMRRMADVLYEQLREGEVSEAALIAEFTDPEEEREAAEVFHTQIPVKSSTELDRAFTDTVLQMLKTGGEGELGRASVGDMDGLTRYIERKKLTEKIAAGTPLHLKYDGTTD